MDKEFFPLRSEARPTIYAYEDSNPEYKGLLKVGYTTIGAEQRVAQQPRRSVNCEGSVC